MNEASSTTQARVRDRGGSARAGAEWARRGARRPRCREEDPRGEDGRRGAERLALFRWFLVRLSKLIKVRWSSWHSSRNGQINCTDFLKNSKAIRWILWILGFCDIFVQFRRSLAYLLTVFFLLVLNVIERNMVNNLTSAAEKSPFRSGLAVKGANARLQSHSRSETAFWLPQCNTTNYLHFEMWSNIGCISSCMY